ncbi:unnamed protein product [Closterium sp. NIES-64]|nr:unnamed protein product [Closterium sp. NIES-64]
MPRASPTSSRNILIAVDPSPDSEKAVAWALKNHIRPSDRVTLLHVRPVVESGPGLFAAYADSTLSAEAMAEVDRVIEKHNAGVRRKFVSNLSHQLDQAKYDIVAVQGADPSPGRTRILGSASAGIHMNSLRLLLDSALPPSLSCLPQVQYDIVAVQDADLRERICESPCNEHVLSAAFSPPFLCLSYHLPLVLWPPPPGAIRHSGSAGRGSQGAHLPRGGEDEGTYTHHGVSGTQYREAVRCGAEMVQYGEAVRERSVVR